MAERNAQSLEIGLGHIGQDIEIDGILGKDGRILPEPDLIEPGFYLVIDAHGRVLFPLTKTRAALLQALRRPGLVEPKPEPAAERPGRSLGQT